MHSAIANQARVHLKKLGGILGSLQRFLTRYELQIMWGGAILYRLALDITYIFAASPQYSYAGLVYTPVSWKYFISLFLYFLIFWYLPKRERSAVIFLLHLQFVYTVAPMLSIYALANHSSKYMMMVTICVLLEIWVIRRPMNQQNRVHISGIQNYTTVMLGVLTIFALVVPIIYNGFEGLKAFDFAYIYEMRARATYPPGFTYLMHWTQGVILPFAVLCSLQRKKHRWTAVLILLQILTYVETGYKFALFILVPVIGIYLLSKSGHLIKLMYCGMAGLLVCVVLAYRLDQSQQISRLGVTLNALLPIRALFIPADIKFDFYELFQIMPKVFFSDGQIGRMLGLTYPFGGSIGEVVHAANVGQVLEPGISANTGYLGDAYAQMGFLGMLLISLLFAAVLRGIQCYDDHRTFGIITALFSIFVVTLNDGPLFTVLLTGGMLLAFFFVFVYFSPISEGDSNGIQRI